MVEICTSLYVKEYNYPNRKRKASRSIVRMEGKHDETKLK